MKLLISVIKTNQLTLYRAEVAACSEINTSTHKYSVAEYKILECKPV